MPAADDVVGTAAPSFEELFAAQWAPLVRLITLMLGDQAQAEEVVQEAFVSVHRRLPGLRDPRTAAGYLRRCAVNGARSSMRHRRVEARHLDLLSEQAPEDPADRSSRDETVMAALRSLPHRQREVLVLRYYLDLSEREIAATLTISAGSVKSHAHRGLQALRLALAETEDDR